MKQALVIGAGKFGTSVAKALAKGGAEVMVIEKNEDLLDDLKDHVARAVVADSTDLDTMRTIGAGNFESAVVAIGEHFEACVLTVAVLKELGVGEIIARANTPREERILRLVGATKVLLIESEMGRRLGEAILFPTLSEQMDLPDGYSILHLEVPARMVGQTLRELDLRAWYDVLVLGVKHAPVSVPAAASAKLDLIPDFSYRVEAGDTFVILGRDDSLAKLIKASRE